MADPLRPLRINASELLRQPGAVRTVELELAGAPLDVVHERLTGDIVLDLRLEALHDGVHNDIMVTGTISAPWATVCRRCLTDVSGIATVEVSELYQRELLDPEAYPIEDNQLDLAPMVRELALLELDLERVCRDECAGLCPVCGADRNVHRCACDTSVRDDRWAALDDIVLDD